MKKIYFFLLLSFGVFFSKTQAQVSNYGFTQSVGTFTPIAGGALLGTITSDDQYFTNPATPTTSSVTGVGFPIGFNFTYNGFIFDRIGVNNNGWIALGQSTLTPSVNMTSTSAYTPLSSVAAITPTHLRSRIAGMGRDIQAQAGSSLRIETTGTAPNRVCIIQWLNYKKFGTGGTGDNINFQIRLNETTNVIDVIYGLVVFNATANTADVGLGGSAATDFNNRTTTTNWNTSTAGIANTDRMAMSATVVVPVPGRTFTWTPPVPCSGAPTPGTTISSANPACNGVNFTLTLQNNPAVSGLTYQWQSSPDGVTYTNIPGATGPVYTTSQTAATYYQAIVTCSGINGTSTPVQVTMAAPTSCYCASVAISAIDTEIFNVTIGSLNNTSTCATIAPGPGSIQNRYSNYTSGTGAPAPGQIFIGTTMPVSVEVGTCGGNFTNSTAIWIDFNQNGIFEASEKVYMSAAGTTGPHTETGNVVIPATATLGITRMRVVTVETATPSSILPCSYATYNWGETEDYLVNIIPCVQGTINTQPVSTSVGCSGNATFTVAATGSLLSYQWQYRTSPTGPWLDVPNTAPFSGANTSTLTVSNTPSAYSGYQFRVVVSGACTAPFQSNVATLTTTPLVAILNTTLPINRCITAAPSLISILNSAGVTTTTSFASAPALNIPIPDNGSTAAVSNTQNVTTIPAGASITGLSVRLNVTHNWVGDLIFVLRAPNGQIFNLDAALGATGGPGPSTGFTNTVISSTGVNALNTGTTPYTATFRADARMTPMNLAPYTNVQPGPTGFIPTTALWSDLYSTANGNWTLALYDYYQDDLPGNMLVNWTLNITYGTLATGTFTPTTGLFTDAAGTVAYTGGAVNAVYANPATSTNYSLIVTTPTCTSAPLTIPVNVSTALSGVIVDNRDSVCVNGTEVLSVSAAAGNMQNIQWQVSNDNGATWTNIANAGIYSGATTADLTITNAPATIDNYQYRAIVSNACNSITTAADTLTVNEIPVVSISASPSTQLVPGMTTTLTATSSVAAANYTWYNNGFVVPNATGSSLVVDIDGLGDYTVVVNDIYGCTGTSNMISITDSSSSIVFIYPSPNTGQFQIRFRSAQGNTSLPRMVNIYDSKGARIYSRAYPVNVPYERLDVDLRNHGKGVYMVELADRSGNRIKAGRVVIF